MGSHIISSIGRAACVALGCGMLAPLVLPAKESAPPAASTPTRHEIWVPTKDLQEVLKMHPNAVLLDKAQYDTLVRDAGKIPPSKDHEASSSIVIEELRVSARVPEDALTATLTYEYHLRNLKDAWCEMVLPYSLAGGELPLQSSRQSLVEVEAEKPLLMTSDPAAWQTKIAMQGEGRHVLTLVFSVPIGTFEGQYSITGFSPIDNPVPNVKPQGPSPLVAPVPTVQLQLPAGMSPLWNGRRLPDGSWQTIANNALGSRTLSASAPGVRAETRPLHLFSVRWARDNPAAVASTQPTAEVSTLFRVMGDKVVSASLIRWKGSEPPPGGKIALSFSPEARVLSSKFQSQGKGELPGTADGRIEYDIRDSRDGRGQVLLLLEQAVNLAPGAVRDVKLPVPKVEGIQGVQWLCGFLVDPDVQLRLGEFGKLGRTLDPNEVLAFRGIVPEGSENRNHVLSPEDIRILTSAVRPKPSGQTLSVPAPSPIGEIPSLPNFMGAFVFDAPPESATVRVESVPDRFGVDADALVEVSAHEVNIIRTLVFHGEAGSTSRASMTLPDGEVFLEVPVNTGDAATWKQVGREIELTWPKGLAAGGKTSLTVRTRRDITPAAADGSGTEKMTVAGMPISGASRVSGYAALKFDESWKVNVTDTTGLETRDARATPVRGRMAWFGLKEWKLGFDLSRRVAVHDATVTAYALPKARQVEIEGQIELGVTGAPLRRFEVKLPPAIAPLLRVTSPLVGEQALDAATGVWTFTLSRELMGSANVRFRMSLPAENAAAGAADGKVTSAVLPVITLPGARRTAGRWVVEANTDTELSFTTRGVQPLDSRRPPTVEGYAAQHRVIAAFSHGGGEHEIRLTATRHDPAMLAGMILIHLRMTSVLGEDGAASHEAVFTLRHNGRQFATVRLPEGAQLLSTMVAGRLVKPVQAGANEVRLPLTSSVGDAAPIEVKVMYDTPSGAWSGSGKLALVPPTLGDEVPVMETQWKLLTPAGFTLWHDGSGLVEHRDARRPQKELTSAPGLWEIFQLAFVPTFGSAPRRQVDFLPGGGGTSYEMDEAEKRVVEERLNRIILPTVQFSGASIEEAIEFLRIKSRDYDLTEPNPALRGINMVIKPGAAPSTATISLDLKDVPFLEALRYVTELGGMKYKIQPSLGPDRPGAIVVVPISDVGTEMYVRKFKVPLAQMLAIQEKSGKLVAPADPFAPAGKDEGKKLDSEVSILDALKGQGIPFPEGAIAEYDRESQTLLVRNTQPSIDLTEQALEGAKSGEEILDNMTDFDADFSKLGTSVGAYYTDKMSNLILPRVQFQDTPVEEAIEFLRIKSRDYDSTERDPIKKGVNLIVKPGAVPSTAKISLDLKDVPLSEALRYVTELAGLKYRVEAYAVVVVPISDVGSEMYTRTFKVPPDFLANIENGKAPELPSDGGLSARSTANDFLKSNGIPAAEGSSATFIPSTNQLIVRNTAPNLDVVENYVAELMKTYIEKRRSASLNRAKSGLVPLELELPQSGQVISLHGHQRPREFTLHYISWERQAARTSLLVLLGIVVFWVLRGGRVWLFTFAATLVLVFLPILLMPSWSAECHALLLGWLGALSIWLLWRVACWWKRRSESGETSQTTEVTV